MAARQLLSGIQIKPFCWFVVCCFGFVFQFCHVVLFPKGISLKQNTLLYATSLTAPFSVPHILRAPANNTKKSQCEPGNPKADGYLSIVYHEKPAGGRSIHIHDIFSNNITHRDHVIAIYKNKNAKKS